MYIRCYLNVAHMWFLTVFFDRNFNTLAVFSMKKPFILQNFVYFAFPEQQILAMYENWWYIFDKLYFTCMFMTLEIEIFFSK